MVIESTSTRVNCEKEGHCWHEGTAVGSFYCCKCGQYLYPTIQNYDTRLIPSQNLTVTRKEHFFGQNIRDAIRILKYDDEGNFIKEL